MRTTIARCTCGEVEVELKGEPLFSLTCYCDDCQAGAKQVEALSGDRKVIDELGGTRYALYRTDRVRYIKGRDQLQVHKLHDGSQTQRRVASCCNAPVLIDFDGWQPWVSVYASAMQGELPPLAMRIFTKFAPRPDAIPDDVPRFATFSLSFPPKVILAALRVRLGL